MIPAAPPDPHHAPWPSRPSISHILIIYCEIDLGLGSSTWSQAGVTFPGTGLRWFLVASESEEEPRAHHDLRHDIRRIITWATLGVISLAPFAVIADNEPATLPGSGPVPAPLVIHRDAPGQVSDSSLVQSPHERIISAMIQGHQENKIFSKITSIIRNAFGAEDLSESMAIGLLEKLIKKYAEKVLENLADDAAKSTSDAIESWLKKVIREFKELLSEWEPAVEANQQLRSESTPVYDVFNMRHALDEKITEAADEQAGDFDLKIPSIAVEAVNQIRDIAKKQSDAHPDITLDSRILSAIQSPAPGAVEAWLSYPFPSHPESVKHGINVEHRMNFLPDNPESTGQMSHLPDHPEVAELVAYLRCRVALGALSDLPADALLHALWKIVDTPIRSSTINEPPSNSQDPLDALPAGITLQDVQNYIRESGLS